MEPSLFFLTLVSLCLSALSVTPGYDQTINDTQALLTDFVEDRGYRTDIRPKEKQTDVATVKRLIFVTHAHRKKLVLLPYAGSALLINLCLQAV